MFAVHLDLNTRERFMYDPDHHTGTWVTAGGGVCCVPPVESDLCEVNDQTTKEEKE